MRLSPLAAYAHVWSLHALLQIHSQPFLLPDGVRIPLLLLIGALLWKPSLRLMAATLVLRNCARVMSMPFVWDSEYWLMLTDVSLLISMFWPGAASGGHLLHVEKFFRCQLALCYAAAALFKVNSSFLDPRTSCAPIFGLSLLELIPPLPSWLEGSPALVRTFASAMPLSVVAAEALIAALLAAPAERHVRFGVQLALLFHLAIAITPPPNGVPTFSCVAASRLILCIGSDGKPVAKALGDLSDRGTALLRAHPSLCVTVVVTAMAVAPTMGRLRPSVDPAIGLFVLLASLNLLALRCSPVVGGDGTPDYASHRGVRRATRLLGGVCAVYAFVLPILGIQEIGSCTMFANVRLVQGLSNNALGIPTGILQAWLADSPASWTFGGGVVRVEWTNSEFLNALYPGEITSLLDPHTRALLRIGGHATRQFNPKARRVLGQHIRRKMPRWEDSSQLPYVRYTVPALELRRMLAEARRAASATNTTFDLTYTRLGAYRANEDNDDVDVEIWRASGRGVTVRLSRDDGRGDFRCMSRDESGVGSTWQAMRRAAGGGGWRACAQDELALLPEPSAVALKLSLYYPYAIVPEAPSEVVCNY